MATEILGSTAFYTVSTSWNGYYLWIYSSYDRQRSGAKMQYKFYADIWITSGAWYNNNLRWIVKINGKEAYRQDTGGQSGSSWKKSLSQSSWYTYPDAVYSGTLPVSYQIYDTRNSGWCNWTKSDLSVAVDTAGAPSISASFSKTSASRGKSDGKATATVTRNAGTNCTVSSWSFSCNGGTSTSITGLKNNTSYSWSASIKNSADRTASNSGSFYLTPHAPSTPSVSVATSRTGATFSVSTSYDTKRKHKSTNISYGKSTSYGSSSTSTSLSNLTPNTTYYYKVTVTDQNNSGAYSTALTSSAKTGSFTTTGNVPSISSVTPDVFRSKAILNYAASYDTNDSFSSLSIKYGTSTSYGSTSTSTTLSGLQPNKTYYYSMTVTSSRGRTSSAKTGSFTTTAYLPASLNISASNTLPFSTNLTVSGSGDTNAGITNYTYYYRTKPSKPVYDMPIKHMSDGSSWARIFYHNNKNGSVLFTSLAECRNTQSADKYSRMYLLEDNTYKGSDGKFEFMLTYPINAPGRYNRWKQTNAPQNEYNSSTSSGVKVAGYSAIHTDFASNYFGGLERNSSSTSSFSPCWLDGSCGHGNWFYAIGTSELYGRGIPSASDIGDSTADVVEIWVRIDDATTTAVSMGTSTTAAVSGLSEETNYIFYMSATNVAGTNYSSSIEVITPADQAKIRIKGSALPDIYQRVEYIQTDGNQVINLGKVGDTSTVYDIAFLTSSHRQLMGYGGSGTEYWGATDSTKYESGGTQGDSTDTTQRRSITWTYSYKDGVSIVQYDGSSIVSLSGASKNVDGDDYKLFNIYSSGDLAQYGVACKLYGLQMTHENNLIHDLIPCYRKSDGVIGLYDASAGKFYVNEGTGNFSKGSNIEAGTGWIKGKTYYKKDGAWVKAKKIYVKVNGQWKIGNNYEN